MNSVKQVQFRRQNGTLPRAKFLSVNQQQKKNKITTTKKYSKTATDQTFKKRNRAQEVSKKGKYQGKFIFNDFLISPGD